ncbi:GNAT family N-acetyltransferase [Pseudoruegeria sp. SHC-113]|uniref:GNAT family N-acetyltransferase n=1 Tax=Pseudoruegeria sp. SHC-113 TaxID=2855439 RepID=UPI0021BA5CD6|nr:GNAT family N-acetyltransferase [Pseudoruegeria sp. SHC-113]MCT8161512.1 GNAT family N-acetyltransferase [Pseudoruegeria sp. SHC-113]
METFRKATPQDTAAIAALWAEGWQDAHAGIVPAALLAARTPKSFPPRVAAHLGGTWIAETEGRLLGFFIIEGAEVYQFYVARAARGTGLATRQMAQAEAVLHADGVEAAWLACSVGNARAAAFYEKAGWRNVGEVEIEVETAEAGFPLTVWRFEKTLA